MSNSNTQINFISSSVIKFLKRKFTYDDSFDTIISLIIISFITNIYTILSYINEDNIKILVNNDEFINNLRYFFADIFIPLIKYLLIFYIIYYLYKHRYHISIYDYFYNLRYKNNECVKSIKTNLVKKNITDVYHDNDKKVEHIAYNIDISNLPKQIGIVYKFMDYHPEFFKRNVSYKLIEYTNIGNEQQLCPVFSGNVNFEDPIHHVHGYLNTKYSFIIDEKKGIIHNYTMNLHIIKEIGDNKCYIKQLENYTKKTI